MASKEPNNFNWIPVALGVVVVVLGIFVLQQTFSRSTESNSISSSSASSDSSTMVESISSRSSSSNSLSSRSSSSSIYSSSSSSDASSSNSSSSALSSSASTSTLGAKDIKATLRSINGGVYNFVIDECGLPDAKICKNGTALNLNLSTRLSGNLTVGTAYQITADFVEIPGGMDVQRVTVIKTAV